MDVGSSGGIPCEASRCARLETLNVVLEVCDDHLQEFMGKSMGLPVHRSTCGIGNPEFEPITDCRFSPMPDRDALAPYDVLVMRHEHRGNQKSQIPGSGFDVGVVEGPPSRIDMDEVQQR